MRGLLQAKKVSIEGHPLSDYNGLYTHDSVHEGWPVLKNANGMFCYRRVPTDRWLLRQQFTPDEGTCSAYIKAKEGPLPVGAHTWNVLISSGNWQGRKLRVGLLVRHALFQSPVHALSLTSDTNLLTMAGDGRGGRSCGGAPRGS